jgi:hypothetical protein
MIFTNTVIYTVGDSKVSISCEQLSTETKFFNDPFKMSLFIGSFIRGETRSGFSVEYECSKEEAVNVLKKAMYLCLNKKK